MVSPVVFKNGGRLCRTCGIKTPDKFCPECGRQTAAGPRHPNGKVNKLGRKTINTTPTNRT